MTEGAEANVAIPEGTGEGFGDYVLLDRIAQGGMAEVFLAKRRGVEGFEKVVAIKRILPELSSNRDFISMFINEAKIAARLSHPNIVQIFDFGKIDNYYFIAMEYVHGENLREVLKHSVERAAPLSSEVAVSIAARACAGLDHAHRKADESGRPLRIIHRDVSPQNVLVSYEGEVKVVDFGIAKAVAENPEATRGVLKGKLSYLSPEQVTGANLDARSDVFAMGVVLYELLAGKKLFDKSDPGEILDAIVHIDSNEVARSLPKADRALREIVRRALHVNPDQRFASAGEMQAALDAYLRDRGDPGGTAQLANLMRLLFDERIGDRTAQLLRSQLLGRHALPRDGNGLPRRLGAALAGAVAAVAALIVVAPTLRKAAPAAPLQKRAERPVPTRAAPPEEKPAAGAAESEVTAPSIVPTVAPPKAPIDDGRHDLEQAKAAIAGSRPAEAVAAYERAFATAPGLRAENGASYAKALTEDGKSRFDSDSEGAADRFKAAIAADPNAYEPHFFLAKVYTRRSDPQGALREYQEAIRIDPRAADAQFNLGFVYFSQRRYEDALHQYEKVIELKPPYVADVFYNLSACYEQLKRKPEAIETLRRGLQAVPKSELLRQRLKQLGGSP